MVERCGAQLVGSDVPRDYGEHQIIIRLSKYKSTELGEFFRLSIAQGVPILEYIDSISSQSEAITKFENSQKKHFGKVVTPFNHSIFQ